MSFNYTILILSLVLLWIPRSWLDWGRLGSGNRRSPADSPRRRRRRVSNERGEFARDSRLSVLRDARDPHNWIDFFRALTAGYGLLAAGITGTALVDIPASKSGPYIAAQILILLLAVTIQMIRIGRKVTYFGPVFFVQGLMFALVGWKAGLLLMLGTWTLTPLLTTPALLLTVLGLAGAAFGALLGVHPVYVFTASGIAFWPVLWTILLKTRLLASMGRRHARIFRSTDADDADE